MSDEQPQQGKKSFNRRAFLKACGALGVGAVAGGVIVSKVDVLRLGDALQKVSQTRLAMGTFVTVTTVADSVARAQEGVGRAFEEMERLIGIFSRHDPATPLAVLNRDLALADPPAELVQVVRKAKEFNLVSGGAFDPTVKPLLDLLDQSFGQSLPAAPSQAQIQERLQFVGIADVACSDQRIALNRPGMGLTLDGIAKGFIVDRMSAVLSEKGAQNHLVNAGGDICSRGSTEVGKPWAIAVQNPQKHRDYPEVIRLRDGAVATSGDYEIYYDSAGVFHHIVSPQTGLSPQHHASVTIRAHTVMEADALATAAFVLEPAAARSLLDRLPPAFQANCLFLDADGRPTL